jgi:predicted nucleotidyltransferase
MIANQGGRANPDEAVPPHYAGARGHVRARANAEHFLSGQGLSLAALRDCVPTLAEGELLMLIGSVPDGLANPLSDIDLLVVGPRRARGDLLLRDVEFEQTIERLASAHEVNVEYWTTEDLLDLAAKFEKMTLAFDRPEGIDDLIVLSETQLRIIHCMANGLVLSGDPSEWRVRFEKDRLINYLVIYFISFYYTFAEDAVGQLLDEDLESALANLRIAVDFMAGAELAAVGETNPYSKWRIKLLRRSIDTLGRDVLSEYLDRLFPHRDTPRVFIDDTIAFCGSRIAHVLQNRPQIVPAAMALSARMRFVTSTDG